MKSSIRIGTRGSALALYQAELVKTRLEANFPMVPVEILKIKTSGDMIRRGAMTPFLTKRIFTREIEDTLIENKVDLAIHSAKDMSVILPAGLKIGAVLEREDPRDCLVGKKGQTVADLGAGAKIGTSSLRRKMQILRLKPELQVEEIHGNVQTRIRKLEEGHLDGILLAYAGLKRLGLLSYVTETFSEENFFPAPGQGVIVIQSRIADKDMDEMLAVIHDVPTGKRLDCERAFLARLEGGCQLPCGITTEIIGDHIKTAGALFDTDSPEWVDAKHEGSLDDPAAVGDALAHVLLDNGGRGILEKIKNSLRAKK